jgi:hypothetical protein
MKFHGTGNAGYLLNIFGTHTAADHDANASGSIVDKGADAFCAEHSGLCGAGGEDAVCAAADDIFQGTIEVDGHIDSAMKGDLHGPGEFDEGACTVEINCAGRSEQTEDDAVRASFGSVLNISAHDSKVILGIAEIAAAWSHHYVKAYIHTRTNSVNQACTRGDAPLG